MRVRVGGRSPPARAPGRSAAAADPRQRAARHAHRRQRADGKVKDLIGRAAAAAGHGPDHRRDRHGQGAGRARDSRQQSARRQARSSRSTAPRSPTRCSRTSCSATRAARSPAPPAPRAGLIEHANGGTLFLDEIGTMAAGVQAKLLRALEAGEVRRIGENDARRVDVRFVAATNADLQAAVDARLVPQRSVLPAERAPHPPAAAARAARRHRSCCWTSSSIAVGPPAGVTGANEAARAALLAFDYPGNVRQLEHVIQRAVAVARGPVRRAGRSAGGTVRRARRRSAHARPPTARSPRRASAPSAR